MFTCCSSPPDMCPWLTGCLNVSWSSSRISAWMITSSWLRLHLVGPRLYTRVSRATSTWCVWLGTASASRRHGFETPWMVTTSSPMVAPISRGVTFVESSFGVFTSKACAVAVSIGKFSGKPLVLKSSFFPFGICCVKPFRIGGFALISWLSYATGFTELIRLATFHYQQEALRSFQKAFTKTVPVCDCLLLLVFHSIR